MDFIFAAVAATFIGVALLAILVSMIVHPRVGQLISDDWVPDAVPDEGDRRRNAGR